MKGYVKIFTYGCQMNDLDSQKIYSELIERGWQPTDDTRLADLIILNTCTVRQKAHEKALSNIGRLRKNKLDKPNLKIVITGCVAQELGQHLFERMPHVDIILGTHQLHRLPDLVKNNSCTYPRVETAFIDYIHSMDIVTRREFLEHSHRAYINIMQGCNNYCAYCIVPYVRGPEISRPAERILCEVEHHARHDVKEIFLLGQNVNSFSGGMSFAELLHRIHSIEGIERIRFTTSHPKDMSTDLIECYATLPKLCSHLHLPFQAGSDKVLARMNRGYTRESYLELIDRLRKARPDMAFSTDAIVGFPDETPEEFQETLDLIRSVRFDVIYSFKYSPRPGTKASDFTDDVLLTEKKSRLRELQTLQNSITLENHRARLGTTYAVLVDGKSRRSAQQIYGRTTHNTIVNFTGDSSWVGQTVRVRITRANQNSLTGKIAQ
ncbi:MAG: tRNA (N6-isopentenyl adenosine(37)-C2)-methylthiotransferase MiaB [Deltaproteobacteria bacterium]|nr:tRNA (N6-isopentenyl adenosine(37)-C2)-methylthiotransferase MiaB [Deltaproteobacteria bacterium]